MKRKQSTRTLMITKRLNVQSVKTRFNHTGNHVTTESEQPVMCVEQIGRSLDILMNLNLIQLESKLVNVDQICMGKERNDQ